eukprot:SAG25_NODE_3254_length_1156_cov_1.174078_2_plen_254_part_01
MFSCSCQSGYTGDTCEATAPEDSIDIDDIIGLVTQLGRRAAAMYNSRSSTDGIEAQLKLILNISRIVAVGADVIVGSNSTAAQDFVSTIEEASQAVEKIVKNPTVLGTLVPVHAALNASEPLFKLSAPKSDQLTQPPDATAVTLLVSPTPKIDDVVTMVTDIVERVKLAIKSDNPTSEIMRIVAKVLDSLLGVTRFDAAVAAAINVRNMATHGASAGQIMAVLSQVIEAITGEPMTSANNPLVKWVREAVTDLL